MIILIFLLIGTVAQLFDHERNFGIFIVMAMGWTGAFLLTWMLLLTQMNTSTYDIQRETLQETYNISRTMNEFERVSITRDIAEFNKQLTIDKYWNDVWMFDWFINDNIENIEPIK